MGPYYNGLLYPALTRLRIIKSMKKCTTCKAILEEKEFAANRTKTDGLASQCKACKKLAQTAWYEKNAERHYANIRASKLEYRNINRRQILEYLSAHPCVDCGETDPVVLEFDHKSEKRYAISRIMERSWNVVKSEIDKCDVRCANCHRRKTAKQLGWYRWVQSLNGEATPS